MDPGFEMEIFTPFRTQYPPCIRHIVIDNLQRCCEEVNLQITLLVAPSQALINCLVQGESKTNQALYNSVWALSCQVTTAGMGCALPVPARSIT
jgi:hypothetical protein